MHEFLQTVAKHYFNLLPKSADGTPDFLELTDWMFVFPSRRAGMFFNNHLCELNGNRPLLAPSCLTIGDLFNLFSDYRIADRTELLFRLYRIQNEVRRDRGGESVPGRFDNFIFWGEMMLRDFDEVDKYLVPADKLFSNVRDLREMDDLLGGLDEETKAILETFWKNVDASHRVAGSAKDSFLQTWSVLFEIYSKFRQSLRQEGLAYEGMRQRDVVNLLNLKDEAELLSRLPKKIVLVGITAINKAERELLLKLKQLGLLECCWDYADPNVKEISFVKDNLRDFGNALSAEESNAGIIPVAEKTMNCIAVPSGVGQATEAAKILNQWGNEDAIHTAVVLPDEHLLDSMLYNVPSDLGEYNVTMGYTMKSTPVASLVDALIFLQGNIRKDLHKGELSFYYKAVLPLLSHAFLLDLEQDRCTQLRKDINRQSIYQVPQSMLADSDLLSLIFKHGKPIEYLRSVLKYLLNAFKVPELQEGEEPGLFDQLNVDKHVLNRECIIAYLQVLDQLEIELAASDMSGIDDASLYHLIQRLALGLSISFSGEPLKGIQIMGVLETRALDFNRMVILSMNEGVVPAKPQLNTFIPHSLRQAFGLPTQIYKDWVFAYHFYRLISRAKEIYFMYDCRVDGMQTGEQSRYLLQLKYLANAQIIDLNIESKFTTQEVQSISIEKTPEVQKLLGQYCKGGNRKLSASNLKSFIACPLQFYFAHVQHLSTDDEMEEEMDDGRFGNILHATLKDFYQPMAGKMVMDDILRKALDSKEIIMGLVKAEYEKQYKCPPTNGYQQLVCSLIESSVKSVLRYDRSKTPFYYLNGECSCDVDYEVSPELVVRLTAVYDRLDVIHNADHTNTLRIVDYKTGSPRVKEDNDKVRIKDIEDIFNQDSQCSNEAFQVLFYGLMLDHISPSDKKRIKLYPQHENNVYQRLEPNLYFTRSLLNASSDNETVVIEDFEPHRQSIEAQMKHLIARIFDVSEPFCQTEDTNQCKICRFQEICNKNIKNDR